MDIKKIYKSEIQDDEELMADMTKKAFKFPAHNGGELPRFHSKILDDFNTMRGYKKYQKINPQILEEPNNED